MEKESVKKFDLEAAFKALDEIDIPAIEKGSGRSKANRVDLKERFSHKPATDTLVEDYYDVSSNEDLEEAKEERDGEVAQAKLARIEKIVDLDAETADDLLPSYVGKVIIQCPQCMTLFYKNPEDIEHSEENPDVVNINEVCQHCGNTSGYTLIGKVDSVKDDETDKYEEQPAEEEKPAEEENELDLDFEEIPEESAEEESSENDLDLDLDLEELPEEEPEEEKKEESLELSKETSENETEHKSENLTLNEEAVDESLNNSEEAPSENETESGSENLTLNENLTEDIDKDLDKKLKEHNDYIEYLKKMIEQEEEALKHTDNEEVKAAIQRRLDAFKEDLEAALPDALKTEAPVEEPIEEPVEEAPVDEEPKEELPVEEEKVEETLTEETEDCKVVLSDEPGKEVFAGTKEECEQIIEKNKDTNTAQEHGLEIVEPTIEESLNKSEEAVSENESENNSEELTLNESAEAEIDSIIASWGDVSENLTEEGDLNKLLDSEEFKTPVSEEEIAEAREDAKEESLEECSKQSLTEEPEDDAKAIIDSWEEPKQEESLEECGEQKVEEQPLKEEDEVPAEEEAPVEEPVENEEAVEEEPKEELPNVDFNTEEVKEVAQEAAEEVIKEAEAEVEPEVVEEKVEEVIADAVEEKVEAEETPAEEPTEETSEEAASEEVKEEEPEIDFDDLQEESFNAHVKDFLTEVYENVSDFTATSCALKEGKLFVEGKISFKSGNEKLTMFEFLPQYGEGKLFFEGVNKDFSEDKAFTLNCSLTEAKELITESFGYKFKINENLVEGLK